MVTTNQFLPDPNAGRFDDLVEELTGVIREVLGRLRSRPDADDVTQITLIALLEPHRRGKPLGELKRLAAGIARRQCARLFRDERRRRKLLQPPRHPDPTAAVVARLDAEAALKALAKQDKNVAAAAWGYWVENQTVKDLAGSLGLSEHQVRRRLNKAVEGNALRG